MLIEGNQKILGNKSLETATPDASRNMIIPTGSSLRYCMFPASAWRYNTIHNIENSVKNIPVGRLSHDQKSWKHR